jgi:multidrug resistance efflux pump
VQSDPRLSEAQAQIRQAESDIHYADSEIRRVANLSWSTYVSDYGSVSHNVSQVDVAQAQSSLDMAIRDLRQAESKLNVLDPDEAQRLAQSARNLSRQAESYARSVESREHVTYQSKLSQAEAESYRRRERERYDDWSIGGGGYSGSSSSGSW